MRPSLGGYAQEKGATGTAATPLAHALYFPSPPHLLRLVQYSATVATDREVHRGLHPGVRRGQFTRAQSRPCIEHKGPRRLLMHQRRPRPVVAKARRSSSLRVGLPPNCSSRLGFATCRRSGESSSTLILGRYRGVGQPRRTLTTPPEVTAGMRTIA